jgi:hypothetical protein
VLLLAGVSAVLLLAGWVVLAQGGYELAWWTVDDGGSTWANGGGYTLGGTIGQPDAGVLSGGGYVLGGGFWRGGEAHAPLHRIYLPLTLCRPG